MPALSTALMTAKQFSALGEDPPGVRLELVDGEIEVSPSPLPGHAKTILQLGRILLNYLDDSGLGGEVLSDTDTVFGEHDVRRPDLLYFSAARSNLVNNQGVQGLPDLAIEVLSPSNKKTDREIKFGLYERSGIGFYWIVDPMERTFEAFRLIDGRYQRCREGQGEDVVTAPPFEELEIPLGRLWLK